MAPESLFIDIMMNVPLIFYAARAAGDRGLYELAVAHCRTTERTLVRARRLDGPRRDLRPGDRRVPPRSRPIKGFAPIRPGRAAWPGRSTDSAPCFTYTGDPADLTVAQRNADCFLARCPESLVPPWDFDVPDGPDRIDDSSAAAIAASGLWNLAAALDLERPARRRPLPRRRA